MKRVWTLVTAAAVALGAFGSPAAALPAARGAVTSLSVVPTTGRAEVVIGIGGPVRVRDFTLRNPAKIVVDITGASLGLPAGNYYDHVARGGIVDVRYSQYRRNIVRVVLTLDAMHRYSVVRAADAIRVSVDGNADHFAAWHLGDAPLARATVSVVTDGASVPATDVAEQGSARAPSAPDVTAAAARAIPAHIPLVTRDSAPAAAAHATAAPTDAVAAPPASAAPAAAAPTQAASGDVTAPAPVVRQVSRVDVRRTVAPPAVLPEMRFVKQQPRITIAWENADIHDVLAAFAAFSGRTIIPSKDVTGKVTAEVTNQPWDVALRALLNANGFDATEDPSSGIIIVDTFEHIAQRQEMQPLETRTIRLNYARANQVAPMVAQRLTRECRSGAPATAAAQTSAAQLSQIGALNLAPGCYIRGTVTPDTLTNSISITDVPSNLVELESYARSMDLRQPQVNIKAKIILVDRSNLEALGLRYDVGSASSFFNGVVPRVDSTGKQLVQGEGLFSLGGNALAAIANATERVPGAALQLVYSTAMGGYTLSTFLEALQTLSLLDVQAEPSATVLNNRTANLTAGTTVPIRVIDAATSGAGGGSFPRSTVQMQQVGVILQVTPQITANRQIQMRVHVENSDVQFQSSDVGAVFPTQKVDNEVLVGDGETAVMGGLTQTSVRYSKSGIPVLVDLPIIGRLFGVTNREETKRDLLILITPHIVDEGEQPPPDR